MGGAILIEKAELLEISNNTFERNKAMDRSFVGGYGYGGAILYSCDPTTFSVDCNVALINNTFIANEASRKGGALRYENSDFTKEPLIGPKDEPIASLPEAGFATEEVESASEVAGEAKATEIYEAGDETAAADETAEDTTSTAAETENDGASDTEE